MIFKQINFLAILLIAFTLSACSSEDDVTAQKPEPVQSWDISQALDSLNISYGITTPTPTRGFWEWAKNTATEAVADKVGGVVGRWAGRAGGSYLGGPVGGYIGGKLGNAAGFVAASYLAHKIINKKHPSKKVAYYQYPTRSSSVILDTLTVGDVHNILLSIIMNNGKSYLTESGEYDINALYYDIIVEEQKLGLDTELDVNRAYVSLFEDFCNSVVDIYQSSNITSTNDYYEAKFADILKGYGMTQEYIQSTFEIIEKTTSAAVVLEGDQLQNYVSDYKQMIENSPLPQEMKQEVFDIGTISVRSTEYWK